MDDVLLNIGANAPPNGQSAATNRTDRRDSTSGSSFQDELRSHSSRLDADSSRTETVTRNDRSVQQRRDQADTKRVKTEKLDRLDARKADAKEKKDSSTPTDETPTKDSDSTGKMDNAQAAKDQQSTAPTDTQVAAQAALQNQAVVTNSDDANDIQTAQVADAAMTAIDAVSTSPQADPKVESQPGVPEFATTATDASLAGGQVSSATGGKGNFENVLSAVSQQAKSESQAVSNEKAASSPKTGDDVNGAKPSAKTDTASQSTGATPTNLFEASSVQNRSTSAVSAEPARLSEARAMDMVSQITRSMETVVKSGQNFLKLQLYPEDMGRIDVRMSASSQGLVVTMVADSASTGKALESQMANLRQSLTSAGIQLAHLGIGQNGTNQQSGQSSQGQSSNRHVAGWVGMKNGDDVSQDQQSTTRISTLTGVDYRV
jgi:flagellar hook-length control protein FliK